MLLYGFSTVSSPDGTGFPVFSRKTAFFPLRIPRISPVENYFQMDFTTKAVNVLSIWPWPIWGDGVFTPCCQELAEKRGQKRETLHLDSIALVKAPTQAAFAEKILPGLTEAERRTTTAGGKNAHTHAAPKSASPREYAMATGLECLFF